MTTIGELVGPVVRGQLDRLARHLDALGALARLMAEPPRPGRGGQDGDTK